MAPEVREVIVQMAKERAKQMEGHLHPSPDEFELMQQVEKEAIAKMDTIISRYNHGILRWFAQVMKKTFISIYEKIIVNEQIINKLRRMNELRKGPILFCPTHRSYIDFLLISLVLYYYKMEVPFICSGEDFLAIPLVNKVLSSAGAFFMRRTLRGDDLYKAVFKEYVTYLTEENYNIEFFIEGTRSRTNKVLSPKFGFMSMLTNSYFKGHVEELTFVPVTINYTRVLEGETFPFELTGEQKVKESLARIIKAVQIFSMNLGSIYLDFCDPIVLSDYINKQQAIHPSLKPAESEKDRTEITTRLSWDIIFCLQDNVRIMPTCLVASIIMMHRTGINEEDLERKMKWLGHHLNQRGFAISTEGLPS
mmetsp:Transcript_17381/g.12422  ORF Transcript_17381/g.12422 Transcript_17381/m.12422 type:complete len:365 (+) Transcript_17381:799-1893(+)